MASKVEPTLPLRMSFVSMVVQSEQSDEATKSDLADGITVEALDQAIEGTSVSEANKILIREMPLVITCETGGIGSPRYHDSLFHTMIVPAIARNDILSPAGVDSTRFLSRTGRSKESDSAIRCSTRAGVETWPNIVLKIGFSGPLKNVHLDATR